MSASTAPVLVLRPTWPAPAAVQAAFSLRGGGVSLGPYASLNLGAHVGDQREAVAENRRRLCQQLELPAEPHWLTQVHGIQVADWDTHCAAPTGSSDPAHTAAVPADAAVTRRRGCVCAVLIADCLPVLLCTRNGDAVGIAHAGWRGLAAGVIEATVAALNVPGEQLLAWLGPAIGPDHFEVGDEVRAAFRAYDMGADAAFRRNARARWQCDLQLLARQRLQALGLRSISAESACTYVDAQRFFSYRRNGVTGRMAALIWLR